MIAIVRGSAASLFAGLLLARMPVDARSRGTFGQLLREYRHQAGLSQELLAERAGLSLRGIQDLERGVRRTPYPTTARRVAEALDLDASARESLMEAARPSARSRAPAAFAAVCELAGTGEPEQVAQALAELLGGIEEPREPLPATLCHALGLEDALLVLPRVENSRHRLRGVCRSTAQANT